MKPTGLAFWIPETARFALFGLLTYLFYSWLTHLIPQFDQQVLHAFFDLFASIRP